ncbi:BTB/POZ domain-containing protein 17 isoform X1 [Nasonia vitripennis]|uniref:BTB domain-containing protein n=2 Tax=Nasonia vitripennis TaxID=7425 RepID=A0A7M7Q9Q4_NASVI|nr:BTB/POZ domain-containing protein 17 isoform X1 [Nasonia vitripennis]XP_031784092.1 BTB/POZ domain-containing protein 17 isoform X1 [Nasonia vitripennis]XP_031784093.1 BTB/POZ domain-containing protein 17 isoform X1 [Nasonia vitripennis]XP_031784094.1 BTB/POZ domain-containing protein 17 isoform X1 [Nasonia vitripennis]
MDNIRENKQIKKNSLPDKSSKWNKPNEEKTNIIERGQSRQDSVTSRCRRNAPLKEARDGRFRRVEGREFQNRAPWTWKVLAPVSVLTVDNSRTVLMKIATLYAERLMNDICLVVNDVEYPAHRLILCASSDVFEVMLMSPQWSESQESRVALQETPQCATIFSEFLRYFYTGHIGFSNEIVLPILSLADKYNVRDLIASCLNFMRDHIPVAAIHGTLVSWFQYSLNCGHNEITNACHNFVKWNIELVAATPDFANFELDVLVSLLHQSSLVIYDELSLFKYLEIWLNHQNDRLKSQLPITDVETTLKQMVIAVMIPIRFPMMSPRQLAELLLSPLTQKYKEFFVERMAIGMSFHSGHNERVRKIIKTEDNGLLLFEPRLYTVDTCSSLLTVENFHSLLSYHTRTLVFSSHSHLSDYAGDKTCEWVVDLYPKGVWFKKFFLIVWQGTVEMPEHVIRSVRLSLTCKEPPSDSDLDMRVKIGVLIYGIQDDVEHIARVKEVIYRFNSNDRILNLDNILPFEELNPLQDSISSNTVVSKYLLGPNKDTLKLHIVISPINSSY